MEEGSNLVISCHLTATHLLEYIHRHTYTHVTTQIINNKVASVWRKKETNILRKTFKNIFLKRHVIHRRMWYKLSKSGE